MNDEEGPQSAPGEAGDGWVTLGSFWSSRRVPGIEEAQEATYVPPPPRIRRRTLIVGCAVALASIAIGVGLVFAAGTKGGSGGGGTELSAAVTLTSSTTVTSTAPTTASRASTTSATVPSPSTTRAAVSSPAASPAPTPVLPRATADPGLPVFQPVPLPAGVTATLSAGSCRWMVDGTLQASGTISSTSAQGRTWNLTMHWLQNSRSLAEQSGLVDLQPGESKPWSLSISQPNPPADLACSLVVAVA